MKPYRPKAKCPKCKYPNVSTVYWPGGHESCPTFGSGWVKQRELTRWLPAVSMPDDIEKLKAANEKLTASWVEHLDRTCFRCGYSWSEAVA